jgi:hypothetical protein
MTGKVLLDILLGLGGVLALIGLGGAVVSVSRGPRKGDVRITVEQDDRQPQIVTLPQDSVVVRHLTEVEGLRLSVKDNVAVDANTAATPSRNRRPLEIAGLLTGAAAGVGFAIPFVAASEIAAIVLSTLGALFLTSLGIVVASLKEQFTRREWRSSTTKQQAEAIRDAALLREHPSRSEASGSESP